MKSRSDRRGPTEAQIVDALHDAGPWTDEECILHAIEAVTPPDAADDAREAISAAVRRVWAERFALWGVA